MTSSGQWSGFPPELIHEIVIHCGSTFSTLKALCLTSRTARYSAIRYLFSQIVMVSADDFEMWLDIVTRMPNLTLSVRQVTFRPCASGREMRPLKDVWEPSRMPRMPKVLRVKIHAAPSLDQHAGFLAKSPAFLSLFPNVIELHLSAKFRGLHPFYALLRACGKLRTLHLVDTDVWAGGDAMPNPNAAECRFDLSKLENLLIHSPCAVPNHFIMNILDRSPPTALRSLKLGTSSRVLFPPLLDTILGLAEHSIQHLDVNSNARSDDMNNNAHYIRALKRRISLPSLTSVTIWLDKMVDDDLINALPLAPNLTLIMLRIAARSSDDILQTTSSLKILAIKAEQSFPQLHRLIFQLYVPRASALNRVRQDLHCEPARRAEVERNVRLWLPRFESGVQFHFEWFDLDPNVGTRVKYDENGFPPWLPMHMMQDNLWM
ncbi:hypothetical protein FB45DRAFT_907612 [Roridomyces roridus]|uniref:Uncharacterized protein n=1 Tax=Roridomyces roridus TaxID=1738132 RepID=A0AAD7FTC3_9AGAR|nr:hypothetical protein FB45DRAFT_907612 [Roridomyces roridus]